MNLRFVATRADDAHQSADDAASVLSHVEKYQDRTPSVYQEINDL